MITTIIRETRRGKNSDATTTMELTLEPSELAIRVGLLCDACIYVSLQRATCVDRTTANDVGWIYVRRERRGKNR